MDTKKPKTITLGELRQFYLSQLDGLRDDTEVMFGGGQLSLYRIKTRLYQPDNKTPKLLDFEFSEVFTVVVDPDTD